MAEAQMDLLTSEAENAAREWRKEAEERRQISKSDPVADTLEYCAGDLAKRLENARVAGEWLTVEEYAAQPDVDVTPQTVRAWIRSGQLAAVPTPRGYKIRKNETRVRRTA